MQWKRQGDEGWQSVLLPLKGEENKELQFVVGKYQKSQFKCAICGKSLSETSYLLYRTVPQTAPRERYCVDHSPIPIETKEGPGLFERLATLEQQASDILGRLTDLEQRIAELETARESNPPD